MESERPLSRDTPFIAFLGRLASGEGTGEDWDRLVVAHHAEPRIEAARIALVRASIAAGSWSWSEVPDSLRQTAARLETALRIGDA